MHTYWRILRFARREAWLLPFYLIAVILHTVFRVINFTALVPLLRILFNKEPLDQVTSKPEFSLSADYFIDLFHYHLDSLIVSRGQLAALYLVCGVLIGSVFLTNLFLYLVNLIQARVRINTIRTLRKRLFERLMNLDLEYISQKRKGDLLTRITSDIQQVEATVVSTLRVLLKEPMLIIGYFITLFNISSQLTLYTLLLVPLSAVIVTVMATRLKIRAQIAQGAIGQITSLMDEALSSLKVIKLFRGQSYIRQKFDRENNQYARQNHKMAAMGNLAGPISEFLGVGFVSVILLIGGQLILSNESGLDAASFLLFLIIFSQVLNPAKAISNGFNGIQKGIASGDRIFDVMDQPTLINEQKNPRELKSFEKVISFKNVDFHYGDLQALTTINFDLPKGKVIALVGPSGSGKSTIAYLLARFFDPSKGSILLDGYPLSDYKLDDLHQQMGLVTQEALLFNDTIYQNILFGKPDATHEEVMAASRQAHAHDFIRQLPEGYETVIGDMGMKVSGGERQRITIARALLKNPSILILDEATSSLDSEAERSVQEAITMLMKGRTTLVIAHRLSTIQHADEILVIEQGKIIEKGTHNSLMDQKGYYLKMVEMQRF